MWLAGWSLSQNLWSKPPPQLLISVSVATHDNLSHLVQTADRGVLEILRMVLLACCMFVFYITGVYLFCGFFCKCEYA